MVVSNGKIKLDFLPDAPCEFAILEIESKKKEKFSRRARLRARLLLFAMRFHIPRESGRAIMKKKAKSKAKTGKVKGKSACPRARKESNPAEVRKDISKIVQSGAKKITKAVMEQATTGQLAPAKYLFEVAGIYPALTDGTFGTEDEECLAKTLMNRLDLPDKPIALDDEDEMGKVGSQAIEGTAGPTKSETPESSLDDGTESNDVPALVRTIP